MNNLDWIIKTAETLDASGRKDVPIRTRSRREYLMKLGLKPAVRGGELAVGGHQIICAHGKEP